MTALPAVAARANQSFDGKPLAFTNFGSQIKTLSGFLKKTLPPGGREVIEMRVSRSMIRAVISLHSGVSADRSPAIAAVSRHSEKIIAVKSTTFMPTRSPRPCQTDGALLISWAH